MCDILHARHVKAYLRFDSIFNMTKIKQKQDQLLATIHGLTKRVIKEKKEVFEKNYEAGKVPTPSLSQIIADDYVVPSMNKPVKKVEGLRDDLDDIDENDVGKCFIREDFSKMFWLSSCPRCWTKKITKKKQKHFIHLIQVKSVVWHFWI